MTNRQKLLQPATPGGSPAVSDYLKERKISKYIDRHATSEGVRAKLQGILLTASKPYFKLLCQRLESNPAIALDKLFAQTSNQ